MLEICTGQRFACQQAFLKALARGERDATLGHTRHGAAAALGIPATFLRVFALRCSANPWPKPGDFTLLGTCNLKENKELLLRP